MIAISHIRQWPHNAPLIAQPAFERERELAYDEVTLVVDPVHLLHTHTYTCTRRSSDKGDMYVNLLRGSLESVVGGWGELR